jgi:uncharacterized protein (TIGR01370 family)
VSARLLVLMLLLLALLVPASSAASVPLRNQRLDSVHSFAFAIGSGDLSGNLATRYASYDLVVVDGEEATARQIAELHAGGKIVLGYLDVGTIEPYRSWYRQAKPYRLGYWQDWGEWYANVSARGYRDLLVRRVAPKMLGKGLDGLFLDNVDMVETHPHLRRGMLKLVSRLGELVHRRHGFLFAQNGADVMGPLLPYLDGWNREDVTFTYDFKHKRYVRVGAADAAEARKELRHMRSRGLLTLSTDYVAANDAADAARAAATACSVGALPFVSNIDLTRIPPAAPLC